MKRVISDKVLLAQVQTQEVDWETCNSVLAHSTIRQSRAYGNKQVVSLFTPPPHPTTYNLKDSGLHVVRIS